MDPRHLICYPSRQRVYIAIGINIRRLAQDRLMKALVRDVVRKLGYDVSRRTPGLVDFLQHRGVRTVVDVGANEGQFGLWLRARGYAGRIISFEPTSVAFQMLRIRAARDANWQVHQLRSEEHTSEL